MAAPKFEPTKTGIKPKQVTKLFVSNPDGGESNREISSMFAQMEQEGYMYHSYIPQSSNEIILIFKLFA
jgi:hypothetical protein